MADISTNLTDLQAYAIRVSTATSTIASAITAKGGTVGANDGLEDFAADIATIPSGGGGSDLTDLIERDITSIDIPNTVKNIGSYAFYGCNGLTTITIPNSVTTIGSYAFYACNGLTTITIPNSVTNIGRNAFYECYNLTTITINKPEGSISEAPWGAAYATIVWTG